jgi:hypothetical protein
MCVFKRTLCRLSPGNYQLTPDVNPNVLSPGYWMLFALNSSGVPSVARVLQANSGLTPTLDFISNQTTALGDPVSLQVHANDPDNDPLTYSATGLPSGLSINTNTGLISGAPLAGGIYQVSVTVDDNDDGAAVKNFTWTVSGGDVGFIERDWWTGISGTTVGSLTTSPDYPVAPTGGELLTSFEAPTNWADNYGTRIFGYLEPDVSGLHTFWIASDDNGELWLQFDTNPANKVRIAESAMDGVARMDEIPGTAVGRDQSRRRPALFHRSAAEGRHRSDNLAVAWRRPGDAGPQVIPGGNLSTEPVAPPATLADTFLTGTLSNIGSN